MMVMLCEILYIILYDVQCVCCVAGILFVISNPLFNFQFQLLRFMAQQFPSFAARAFVRAVIVLSMHIPWCECFAWYFAAGQLHLCCLPNVLPLHYPALEQRILLYPEPTGYYPCNNDWSYNSLRVLWRSPVSRSTLRLLTWPGGLLWMEGRMLHFGMTH